MRTTKPGTMDSATAGSTGSTESSRTAGALAADLSATSSERPPTMSVHASGPVPVSVSVPGRASVSTASGSSNAKSRQRSRRKQQDDDDADDSAKRRCVSTACIACRKRKSKCDGNTPACAACSQVYGTECIYDPNSDHRRKGVYKNDIDNPKTRNSTLHTIIQAILNYPEDEVPGLVREIRTCESLETVAEKIVSRDSYLDAAEEDDDDELVCNDVRAQSVRTFESQLYGKMGDLRVDEGSVRYIGGTSNLIHLAQDNSLADDADEFPQHEDPITSWTTVTDDAELVMHLVNMYFTWHYTFFTTLSKKLFLRDFLLGRPPATARRKTHYCTPLLVNAILALGCHFTYHQGTREDPEDATTAGDHFFREAKRLIMENDEHEKPLLTTVQALALMSVREAGCGREARGWVYSGMSFRMACDMGLNLDASQLTSNKYVSGDEFEEDVRRITFWGCYLFDKCWSNYLGRLPQLPTSIVTVSKYDVFPDEEADQWSPYTDSGFSKAHTQPARTRAVALEIAKLCAISNDVMKYFYNPIDMEKAKGRALELRKLSDIHTRLESWRRELPPEMEPKEGGLPSVLVMHMFFQLLFIHLFRPFLKYTQATSPLPHTVSPRKLCTQAAAIISKLMRLYKRSHGLRQICNVAVYIAHSACTIHLLNLPDKNAKRDITHGVKHLEEIAEGWPCARRTLGILSLLASKWKVELPEEAALVLARTDAKFGAFQRDVSSPEGQRRKSETPPSQAPLQTLQLWQNSTAMSTTDSGMVNTPISPAQVMAEKPSASADVHGADFRQATHVSPVPQFPAATAVNTAPSRVRAWEPGRRGQPATSPSDMFGGVEQLIRDSNEWTYRDQAQLATGFGNWNTTDVEPVGWLNAATVNGNALQASVEDAVPAASVPSSSAATQVNPHYGNNAVQAADGMGVMTWLSDMNTYNSMASTYDESEWYQ